MAQPHSEPSASALQAASFAESLARGYAAQGGVVSDLFTAFVGIVAEQDSKLASISLIALEGALSRRASAGNASPSV